MAGPAPSRPTLSLCRRCDRMAVGDAAPVSDLSVARADLEISQLTWIRAVPERVMPIRRHGLWVPLGVPGTPVAIGCGA